MRFGAPLPQRKLSSVARLQAMGMALARVRSESESFDTAYSTARRLLLARHDDDAYHAFARSFHFCQECREFVCTNCWSATRRLCLTCVARSLATLEPALPAPEAPQADEWDLAARPAFRARLRRDSVLLALVAALAIVVLEVGSLLAAGGTTVTSPAAVGSTRAPEATAASPARPTSTAAVSPSPLGSPDAAVASDAAAGHSAPGPSSTAGATWPPGATASRMKLLTPCPDMAGCYLYTVRGADANGSTVADTLEGIAAFFGDDVAAIRAMNSALATSTAVYSGETLRLPPPTK